MKVSVVCILWMLTGICMAQEWKMVKQVDLPYSISSFALDQDDMLYLGSVDGNIYRYDPSGKEEQLYSDVNRSSITLIEPWNRLKLFLFYRENQVIQIQNRFVTSPQEISIRDLNVEFASMAAPGVDNSIWIYAANFHELRKYVDHRMVFNTPLTSIHSPDPVHLRAFQNIVILLDAKTGFFFFDQFGNYASSLPIEGTFYFQLVNGNVITYDGHDLITFDPFSPDTIEKVTAPTGSFVGVVQSRSHYLFIGSSFVAYYQLID